jgi:dynein heavy chain, axonemal
MQVRQWKVWGLPADDVSVDNGILVRQSQRWPLMIDPQGQANNWIRNMESRNGLQIAKMTDGNFVRALENAVRFGNPLLVQDIGEALVPSIEPVLQGTTQSNGERVLVRIGDNEVEWNPKFRCYFTTKLSNPHYLPEVCIKVAVINFTVTMSGLEDQLLAGVVRQERPELEEQKDRCDSLCS